MSNNYYEILGVSSNASPVEIQSAYRRAAIQNHPDRGGDHSKMVLINEAYGILSEPELRAEYDRLCRDGAAIEPGSTWWTRTESVRTAAAAYPASWADFEKWASHFAADVSNAKYGKQYLWYGISMPTIEGSSSGVVFCVIGAALGVLIIGVHFDLYPSADRVWRLNKPSDAAIDSFLKGIVGQLPRIFVLFSPILIGSWAGYFAHRWVHSLVTQPATGVAPDSPAPTHSVLVCNGCGQKVRVPRLDEEIVVTCPKCRTSFSHSASKAESDHPEEPADGQPEPPPNPSSVPGSESASKPQPSSTRASNTPIIMFTLIGILVACIAIFSMSFFIKTLLWLVLGASALGIVLFIAVAASSDTKDSERSEAWLAVAFCFGIGFFAWLFIPTAVSPDLPSNTASARELSKDRAQSTLDYWNALPLAMKEVGTQQPRSSAEVVAVLRSAAQQINLLSTANVDENAVQSGLALHGWLEFVATNVENQNSATSLISAIARGYQGDLFGPFLEAIQADKDLQIRLDQVRSQLKSARAILSSRYGVEFQHLD